MLLALGIGVILMHRLDITSMAVLERQVDAYARTFTIVRLGLIGTFALAWPSVLRWRQRLGYIDAGRVAALTAIRWRIVAWLLIIELLIGQNLVARTLSAFNGAAA
ncbi:MAG: hypothetical protein WD672_13985 [Woeseia sp.]